MFKNILNVIIVILIILIIIASGYLGYAYYKRYKINSDSAKFLDDEFDKLVVQVSSENNEVEEPEVTNPNNEVPVNNEPTNNTGANNTNINNNNVPLYYRGYPVLGKLEMPSINIRYPIIDDLGQAKGIEVSIIKVYGPEINQPGNFVIAGHNYNNGLFFGKNKNLKVGDKIYITDLTGKKVQYTIYKTYYTPESDYAYLTKNTNGAVEVTLYTCDATGKNRLVVCARAE